MKIEIGQTWKSKSSGEEVRITGDYELSTGTRVIIIQYPDRPFQLAAYELLQHFTPVIKGV